MKHTVTDARPARGIVVMGVSGSGKSSLGQGLAALHGVPFIEGDDFHSPVRIAKMASGIPLDDIDRWPWLDSIGAALGESARQKGIAVASCSALKRTYRDRLRAAADISLAFVCLVGTKALLLARLQSRTGHYMPVTLLESQLAILEPPNKDERGLILDAGEPVAHLSAAVEKWLAC
jgi:gluconokinase